MAQTLDELVGEMNPGQSIMWTAGGWQPYTPGASLGFDVFAGDPTGVQSSVGPLKTALQGGKTTLLVGPGTYLIDQTVTIDQTVGSNITVQGIGGRGDVTFKVSGNHHIFQIIGKDNALVTDITFKNITFDLQNNTSGAALRTFNIARLNCEDCDFIGINYRAVLNDAGKVPLPVPGAPTLGTAVAGTTRYYRLLPNVQRKTSGNVFIDGFAGPSLGTTGATGTIVTTAANCPGAAFVRLVVNRTGTDSLSDTNWIDLGAKNAADVLSWTDDGSVSTQYKFDTNATAGTLRDPAGYSGTAQTVTNSVLTDANQNWGTLDLTGWYVFLTGTASFPVVPDGFGYDSHCPTRNPGNPISANTATTVTGNLTGGKATAIPYQIALGISQIGVTYNTNQFFTRCRFIWGAGPPVSGQEATMTSNATTSVYRDCEWSGCQGNGCHNAYYYNDDLRIIGGSMHDTTHGPSFNSSNTASNIVLEDVHYSNNAGVDIQIATTSMADAGKTRAGYLYTQGITIRRCRSEGNTGSPCAINLGSIRDFKLERNVWQTAKNNAIQFTGGGDGSWSVNSGPGVGAATVALSVPPRDGTLETEHYLNNNNNAGSPTSTANTGAAVLFAGSSAGAILNIMLRNCTIEDTQTTPTQYFALGFNSNASGSAQWDGLDIDPSNQLNFYGGKRPIGLGGSQSDTFGYGCRFEWRTPTLPRASIALGGTTIVGTGASITASTVQGNDLHGYFQLTTGSSTSAKGTIATITFSHPWPTAASGPLTPVFLVRVIDTSDTTLPTPLLATVNANGASFTISNSLAAANLTAAKTYGIRWDLIGFASAVL